VVLVKLKQARHQGKVIQTAPQIKDTVLIKAIMRLL